MFLLLFFYFAAYELVGCVYQRGLVHAETVRAFGYVGRPRDLVLYHRHALYNAADGLGAFYRVGNSLEQQVCLELDEVCLMRFDIVAELLRRVLLRETVGVVAVWQQQNLHVHALGQQHVDATDRGVYAGGVAVVKHRYVVCEAVYQAYLSRGERCS